MNPEKKVIDIPSLRIPKDLIKGSVGAGDAFCAGCLYGFYKGFSPEEMLEFASGAAAFNLTEADSVSGMKSKDEIRKLCATLPKRKLF